MMNPVIALDSPEAREASIKAMIADMRELIENAEHGSLDARSAAAMIEIMPPFLRFLDRERVCFIESIRDPSGSDHLDEFLQMTTLPLVNMLGASLMTIVPSSRATAHHNQHDMRLMLLRNVMDNLFSGVVGYLNSAEDQLNENRNGKLHS